MLMIAFDLIMSIFQVCLLIYTLKRQLIQHPHSFLWECGCVLLSVLYLACIQYLHFDVPDTLMFLILLAYTWFTADERFLVCILWVAIDAFLTMGTLALVSSFFDVQIGINGDIAATQEEAIIIYGFAGNASITVVLSIAARINRKKAQIPWQDTVLFFLMLVICFFISESFFFARVAADGQRFLLTGSACTFAVMILIIILYEHMMASARKVKQAEMSAQTAQLITEHQDELKSIYERMLAQQHDLQHRIAAAEEILSKGALKEDQKNEALLLLKQPAEHLAFLTGSIAVDAVLTAKATIMDKEGIVFDFAEYPLNPLPVSEQKLCTLLGNLLDNAIEGVMALPADAPSRRICLAFSKRWNMLFITCVNDADISRIKRRGEEFLSTKVHPELHGFGIDNMRRIVDEEEGTIEFEVKNGQFTVQIMLGGNSSCSCIFPK